MKDNRDLIYLHHILQCIEIIENYTSKGKDDFLGNILVQDGVLRRLQIMAESTQRLSDQLKAQTLNVDWKALSGFRNILVHDYLGGISLNSVWEAIGNDLPSLKQEVQIMLRKFDS